MKVNTFCHMIFILLYTVAWLTPRASHSGQWISAMSFGTRIHVGLSENWRSWGKIRENKKSCFFFSWKKRQTLMREERAHDTFELSRLILGQLVLIPTLQSSKHPSVCVCLGKGNNYSHPLSCKKVKPDPISICLKICPLQITPLKCKLYSENS